MKITEDKISNYGDPDVAEKAQAESSAATIHDVTLYEIIEERSLRAALGASPNDPEILNELAFICYDLGRHEETRQLFERAIACDPESIQIYFDQAAFYYDMDGLPNSAAVLSRLFRQATAQRVGLHPTLDSARDLQWCLQSDLADGNKTEVVQLVCDYQAEILRISGHPVQIWRDCDSTLVSEAKTAWSRNSDTHLITVSIPTHHQYRQGGTEVAENPP